MNTETSTKRGKFICFEGLDRSGKTTQAERLVEFLQKKHGEASAVHMRFPDRATPIGKMINEYLSSGITKSDEVIHMLFSTNRWEKEKEILKLLSKGTSIVCDRYAYSGAAYTLAKGLRSAEWCKKSDSGLPKPDKVIFLECTVEDIIARKNFGEEKYETREFQTKVYEAYKQLQEADWAVVDGKKTMEEVSQEIFKLVESFDISGKPLSELWV